MNPAPRSLALLTTINGPDVSTHDLVHLSPDAVVIVDAVGMVIEANDEAGLLFGTAPAVGEAFGVPTSDLHGWSALTLVTDTGPLYVQARTRELEWSGQVAHVIAMRPIAAPEALARQQKAEVRHDLDNAIHVARGYASTLAAHWEDLDEDVRANFLERLVANLDGIADLAADLTDATSGTPAPLPRRVRIADVLADAAACAPAGAPVRVDTHDHDDQVFIDRAQVRRILRNLVANAVRHGHPPLHLVSRSHEDGIEITLTDSGTGISPELADTLFDRGISGGGSSGLGLHAARELARGNGGSLSADPAKPGHGATFRLWLPKAD